MHYLEPESLSDAIKILDNDDEARCIAGGATLVAMMNAELLDPSTLIGLRRVRDLFGIDDRNDHLRIGAMNRHDDIATSEILIDNASVIKDAARQIAHPAIRNMGTIGGSICHADPAADFPSALVAADAKVEIAGPAGKREIPVEELFVDYLETSLEQNEILSAVLVPKLENAYGRHLKFCRTHGDYATVSISVVIKFVNDTCEYARVSVGSVSSKPLHLDEVDKLLIDSNLSAEGISKAADLLQRAADPVDDVRGSAEYRRRIIPGLLKRAFDEVRGSAKHG